MEEMRGIGDTVVPYVIKKVVLKIGDRQFNVRLGWALIEEVPILIGRLDFFDFFKIEFDQQERILRFIPKE